MGGRPGTTPEQDSLLPSGPRFQPSPGGLRRSRKPPVPQRVYSLRGETAPHRSCGFVPVVATRDTLQPHQARAAGAANSFDSGGIDGVRSTRAGIQVSWLCQFGLPEPSLHSLMPSAEGPRRVERLGLEVHNVLRNYLDAAANQRLKSPAPD